MKKLLQAVHQKWEGYKYRFLPWIMFKLPQSNPAQHDFSQQEQDDLLVKFIQLLSTYNTNKIETENEQQFEHKQKFSLRLGDSNIKEAGKGVFISHGKALKGDIVAIYPGTVYMPSDSKFFPSLNNPFLFRCHDNICIDGKNSGLSKSIYKSCGLRDTLGKYKFCDFTWLDPYNSNCCFFNVGQFVNNQNNHFSQNVEYQEIDVPHRTLPLQLRQFFPNVNYNNMDLNFVRTVVLVATKDIEPREELFSNYFTIVNTV